GRLDPFPQGSSARGTSRIATGYIALVKVSQLVQEGARILQFATRNCQIEVDIRLADARNDGPLGDFMARLYGQFTDLAGGIGYHVSDPRRREDDALTAHGDRNPEEPAPNDGSERQGGDYKAGAP